MLLCKLAQNKERTSCMNSEFVLTQGAGQKLEFAVNRNGGSTTDMEWLSAGENFRSVSLLARGEAELVIKTKTTIEFQLHNYHLQSWVSFYHTYFGLTTDLSGIRIPAKKDGFDCLIVVARGMSINLVYETGKKNFRSWKWCGDEDLESQMKESERGPVKESYAFWVRDNQEADEDMKNQSAQMIADSKEKIDTENLLERLLHGFKYWSETKNHLDISTITLCASSRYVDGDVPGVDRDDDGLVFVDGFVPEDRYDDLRARRAVR